MFFAFFPIENPSNPSGFCAAISKGETNVAPNAANDPLRKNFLLSISDFKDFKVKELRGAIVLSQGHFCSQYFLMRW